MARDWESWLQNSIGPASSTEEADRDRTERRIHDAIAADDRLAGKVRVFVKGSYANNTNVRRDSDVDIGVEWKRTPYISKTNEAREYSWEQLGVSVGQHGPTPAEYRRWVETALQNVFGAASVDTSGNKAITVAGGPSTLDADVVPCFGHARYDKLASEPHIGIRLYPRVGHFIENWPEQTRQNGVTKNTQTQRRYKQIIRALKRLENDMVSNRLLASEVHGYFIECLLYNLPNEVFQRSTYKDTTLATLSSLWNAINDNQHLDWVEVNGLKWLWRSGQSWTPDEASEFAHAAWNFVREG